MLWATEEVEGLEGAQSFTLNPGLSCSLQPRWRAPLPVSQTELPLAREYVLQTLPHL